MRARFWLQYRHIYRAEMRALNESEECLGIPIPRKSFRRWMKGRGKFGPWPRPWEVADIEEFTGS